VRHNGRASLQAFVLSGSSEGRRGFAAGAAIGTHASMQERPRSAVAVAASSAGNG
jgi:hypothetical protein